MRKYLTLAVAVAALFLLAGCQTTDAVKPVDDPALYPPEPNPSQSATLGAAESGQPADVRMPTIVTDNTVPAEAYADSVYLNIVDCKQKTEGNEQANTNTGGATAESGREAGGRQLNEGCADKDWNITLMSGKGEAGVKGARIVACDRDLQEETGCRPGDLLVVEVGDATTKAYGDRAALAEIQAQVEALRQGTAVSNIQQAPANQEAVDQGDRLLRLIDARLEAFKEELQNQPEQPAEE